MCKIIIDAFLAGANLVVISLDVALMVLALALCCIKPKRM
jgi:hypothetical protein